MTEIDKTKLRRLAETIGDDLWISGTLGTSEGDTEIAYVRSENQTALDAMLNGADICLCQGSEVAEYLVVVQPRNIKALLDEIAAKDETLKLHSDNKDLEATFDFRWKADMRAIERWHAAGNNPLRWPDHADLCVWLMEQLAAKEQENTLLSASLKKADAEIDRLRGTLEDAATATMTDRRTDKDGDTNV